MISLAYLVRLNHRLLSTCVIHQWQCELQYISTLELSVKLSKLKLKAIFFNNMGIQNLTNRSVNEIGTDMKSLKRMETPFLILFFFKWSWGKTHLLPFQTARNTISIYSKTYANPTSSLHSPSLWNTINTASTVCFLDFFFIIFCSRAFWSNLILSLQRLSYQDRIFVAALPEYTHTKKKN